MRKLEDEVLVLVRVPLRRSVLPPLLQRPRTLSLLLPYTLPLLLPRVLTVEALGCERLSKTQEVHGPAQHNLRFDKFLSCLAPRPQSE